MSSLTKVALVQMKMDVDPKKNLSKAIEKIKTLEQMLRLVYKHYPKGVKFVRERQ